jgi:adenylate cyclase
MPPLQWQSKFLPHTLSIFLLIIILAIWHFDALKNINYSLNDTVMSLAARDPVTSEDIVIIDIDDYSLNQMTEHAGKWSWPRSVYAELLDAMVDTPTRALIFDILFAEPDRFRPDADSYFNEVVAEQENIYFSTLVLKNESVQSGVTLEQLIPYIKFNGYQTAFAKDKVNLLLPGAINPEHWQLGSTNFLLDSDGIGRRYYIDVPAGRVLIPSLPAIVSGKYDQALNPGVQINPALNSKNQKNPQEKFIYLNWQYSNFNVIPFIELYQGLITGDKRNFDQLDNKFIIFGATASGLHDIKAVPINNNYPGVFILATALENIINDRQLRRVDPAYELLTSLLVLLMIVISFFQAWSFNRQWLLSTIILVVSASVLVSAEYILLTQNTLFYSGAIIMEGAAAYIAVNLGFGLKEHLERRKAENMFGRFVEPKVVQQLLADGKLDLENISQQCTLTVLFSDIRGFTTLSEQQTAGQIVQLLNNYFDMQVKTIFKNDGTLDKFIGDCIMAFWGAPVSNDNQAVDAVKTALEMEQHLIKFRESLPEAMRTFDVGIGVHTGSAVVGMIGSTQRVDYTAIGDTVNLASRIEGLTKDKARILVSEATMLASEHAYHYEYSGEYTVKGRNEDVKLYRPTGSKNA